MAEVLQISFARLPFYSCAFVFLCLYKCVRYNGTMLSLVLINRKTSINMLNNIQLLDEAEHDIDRGLDNS